MERNNVAELSYVQYVIAAELDRPSVYIGGPSIPSLTKAKTIVESLRSHGVVFAIESLDTTE